MANPFRILRRLVSSDLVKHSNGDGAATIANNDFFELGPVANAGANQYLNPPATTATISGTATAYGGKSIVSTTWSLYSGSGSITSPSSLSTGVTGLAIGLNIFKLVIVDSNGMTATAYTTVSLQYKLYPKQIVTATSVNTIDLVTLAFKNVTPGARLYACFAQTDSASDPSATTSSAGLSWSKVLDGNVSSSGNAEVWTALFPAGGDETFTMTWADVGSSVLIGLTGIGYEITGMESVAGGATAIATLQTNPLLAITTGRDYSLVIGVVSDFNANDGASRAIRNSATESFYFFQSGMFTSYYFFKIVPTAGAAGNFGYSAPTMTGGGATTLLYEIREALPSALKSFNQAYWN